MPKTPEYFKGKTIFITGGTSGIGKATAEVFAREGANVVVVGRNEEKAVSVANSLDQIGGPIGRPIGGQGLGLRCDVTKRTDVDTAVAAALDRFGQIDFLFNSAGSAIRRAKFLEIDLALWEKTYALNVTGTFQTMQAMIPHMLDQGKGLIVNMSSSGTRSGGAGKSVHYASSKGAVHTMSIGVGREFGGRGIRCLSLSPSVIDTPFQDGSSAEMIDAARKANPLKRIGEANEVAEMVLFVCSDACEFLNAESFFITGGK
jgi:3-oxoacyl-[acyl-carrier protein] reductase